MSEKGNMINLCGLYENEGPNGKYLGGTLGFARVMLFKNKNKKGDKSPDYWLTIAPKPPKKEG